MNVEHNTHLLDLISSNTCRSNVFEYETHHRIHIQKLKVQLLPLLSEAEETKTNNNRMIRKQSSDVQRCREEWHMKKLCTHKSMHSGALRRPLYLRISGRLRRERSSTDEKKRGTIPIYGSYNCDIITKAWNKGEEENRIAVAKRSCGSISSQSLSSRSRSSRSYSARSFFFSHFFVGQIWGEIQNDFSRLLIRPRNV